VRRQRQPGICGNNNGARPGNQHRTDPAGRLLITSAGLVTHL
jgi:hypothetical protein